ncbi:MAG TPA: LLM class flavin-dependent oxidoreductase [Thermomicrobiaceae bacterium]|nr:LLM class flavin-dependent oxidoreductase [Thermomicrobiaceae bacterium]
MRFGVHIGQQNCTIDDLRRLWTWADRGGLYWFSVWDHFYCKTDDSAPHFEAIPLMAAAAVETRDIRIGCLVFCAAYRNPGLLVKSMVTIDHLSGGRATVGLGAGWHEPEYRAYGYHFGPPRERLDLLEENAAAVRQLLDRETTSLDGRYVQLANAYSNPKPVGPMPLCIGGGGEKRTLRIAARYADSWNAAYIGPEDFRHKSAVLDHWCETEGRDPASIERSVNLYFYMGADEAAVPATTARMREQLLGEADTRRAGALTGSPREAVDRIGAYRDAGVEWLNVAIRPPIDWEALQAFLEEVAPTFA